MFATKLPFCSGGITHPLRCQGLSSFFLEYGVSIHGRCCRYNQIRQLYPPGVVNSIWQSLLAVHCNSVQPDVLQNHCLLSWAAFIDILITYFAMVFIEKFLTSAWRVYLLCPYSRIFYSNCRTAATIKRLSFLMVSLLKRLKVGILS